MLGRFVRADEVNDAAARVDRCSTPPRRSSPRASRRGCRPRSSATAPSCRGSTSSRARDVFVAQPGESWIRPARAVPLPRRAPTASSPRPRPPATPWPPRRAARRATPTRRRRPSARRRHACSTSPRSGPGPFATAWLAAMGADVIKVEAVQRPDGIRFSARGAPARGPAVLREVGAVPRVEPRQARDHARPRSPRRARRSRSGSSRGATSSSRTSRRACSSSSASTTTPCARSAPTSIMLRMPAFGLDRAVARPARLRADDGAAHRHGVGHRLRGRPADHPGRPRRPDGRHARRARARRRARAPRPHRRGAARRGAAGRGRDRGHRRAGDPLLDRRHAARPARRRRRVPLRRRRRRGSRSTVDADPLPPSDARGVVRDAHRRRRGARAASRRASRPRRWCPAYATLDDPQLRARGFFEPIDASARRRRRSTRRGRCACRPGPQRYWTRPAPTLGQHTDEVLRDELGVDDDELDAPPRPST